MLRSNSKQSGKSIQWNLKECATGKSKTGNDGGGTDLCAVVPSVYSADNQSNSRADVTITILPAVTRHADCWRRRCDGRLQSQRMDRSRRAATSIHRHVRGGPLFPEPKNVSGGTDVLGKWKPVPGNIRIRASIFTSIFNNLCYFT